MHKSCRSTKGTTIDLKLRFLKRTPIEFAGTELTHARSGAGTLDEGVRARIACPAASPLAERASVGGIPILPIEKRGLVDRDAIRVLRRLLQSGEIQIVHAHNGRTALSAALAVQWQDVARAS